MARPKAFKVKKHDVPTLTLSPYSIDTNVRHIAIAREQNMHCPAHAPSSTHTVWVCPDCQRGSSITMAPVADPRIPSPSAADVTFHAYLHSMTNRDAETRSPNGTLVSYNDRRKTKQTRLSLVEEVHMCCNTIQVSKR